MEYNIANILILFAIISSVVADSGSTDEIKRTVLDSLSVCPPFGKNATFEVETIQTKSLMYGCAYMGNDGLLSTAPLFHLWLERPEPTSGHGHCDNTQNMDHFIFECLSNHDRPTNKDESEMGWHYISLLEHTAESLQNKTKTRSHRCAFYDVYEEDDLEIRKIRMVISKPLIGEEFNVSQCNGLSDLLARDLLPIIPEGNRYWPDGSLYINLLRRKANIFYNATTKKPVLPVTIRPTTTTSRPSTTTTTSLPSTTPTTSLPSTTTTTSLPSTTTTTTTTTKATEIYRYLPFFLKNYYYPSSSFMLSVGALKFVVGTSHVYVPSIRKLDKWMLLGCTVGYKWVTVMDGVKFDFNDLISLYKKNDSERSRFVSLDILYSSRHNIYYLGGLYLIPTNL